MNEQLKALVDVRDRFVMRFADFDAKALTLLFGIGVAWGFVKGTSLPAGPLVAVFLAFAGLFVSIGWVIQRRLLWRSDDSYADALKAMAKPNAGSPLAHELALNLPPATSARARMHYGEPLSVAVFALLTAVAIWSYQAPSPLFAPDMAMSVPEDARYVTGAPPELLQAIPLGDSGQVVLLSPYQMEVLALTDSYGVECPCDRDDYAVTSAPAAYGQGQASLARHMPFDPSRQLRP